MSTQRPDLLFKYIFIVLFSLFFSDYAYSQNGKFDFEIRNYNQKDGLFSTSIYETTRDYLGFQWFATEAEIFRYDGSVFEHFSVASGLADNENFKFFEDSKHRIWIAAYNGQLCYYWKGKFYTASNNPSLKYENKGDAVLNFMEDKNGNIYFVKNSNSLYCFNGKMVVKYKEYEQPASRILLFKFNNEVHLLYTDIVQANYNIVNLEQNKITANAVFTGIHENTIYTNYTFPYDKDKNIFFNKNSVYFAYADKVEKIKFSDESWIKPRNISCFARYNNYLLVGTLMQGVLIFSYDSLVNQFNLETNILQGKTVTSIKGDVQSGIWVTTLGSGVFWLKENKGITYGHWPESTPITKLFYDEERKIWLLGSTNGKVYEFKENKYHLLYETGSGYNRIRGIVKLPENEYLLCAENKVIRFNYITKSAVGYDKGGAFKYALDDKDSVWLLYGLRLGFYNKISKSHRLLKVSADKYISAERFKSHIYLGRINGLSKLVGSKDQKLETSFASLKTAILCLKTVQNNLLIGTNGNGLFAYDGNKVIALLKDNEQLANCIVYNIQHKENKVWVATNRGVVVLEAENLAFSNIFTWEDGLPLGEVKDCEWVENKLYVAVANEWLALDLSAYGKNLELNKPIIRTIKYGDSLTPVYDYRADEFVFKTQNQMLKIDFRVPDFSAKQSIYYYARINGQDWFPVQNGVLEIFSMRPGKYEIELRYKKYRQWSGISIVRIEIVPRFYQIWYIQLLFWILAIFTIGYFLYRRIEIIRKKRESDLQRDKKMVELQAQALVNQMNPHFIFNSMSTAQHFILDGEPEEAVEYLAEFSSLIRKIMQYSRAGKISIKEEILFLKEYLRLESMRFNNTFNYEIQNSLSPDFNANIPSLLIQPIVENAIKHGASKRAGGGMVKVHFFEKEDYLLCEVQDNGYGIQTVSHKSLKIKNKHDSTALKVLKDRLDLTQLEYGRKGEFFCESDRTGTCILLKIPFIRS